MDKERRVVAILTKKIELICESAYEKKAEAIVIMDMNQKATFCDFFIVMSASSSVRVKAIVDHVDEMMKKEHGSRAKHKEGYAEAMWVLLDYGDVVVHVFYDEKRKFYDLENLWGDAPKRHFLK